MPALHAALALVRVSQRRVYRGGLSVDADVRPPVWRLFYLSIYLVQFGLRWSALVPNGVAGQKRVDAGGPAGPDGPSSPSAE